MRISLRLKLALISLLLLIIPATGIRLAGIVKTNLLESRKEALIFSARAVASALSGREGLFDRELFHSLDQNSDLYLFELTNPMRLNGKIDDWLPQLDNAEYFGSEHILYKRDEAALQGAGFRHLVGKRGEYLYTVFLVDDDSVVLRQKKSLALDRSDHLQITVEDRKGNRNNYYVSTTKPGWVNGFLMISNGERLLPLRNETRIQGVWQNTEYGYLLELRIPLTLVGKRLAFAIADVDDPIRREISTIIGTASMEGTGNIGWLLPQSSTIADILESLNRPQSRIQIVDSNQHIRASYGSMKTEQSKENSSPPFYAVINDLLSPLFRLFTEPIGNDISETSTQPSTLDIAGVKEALLGDTTISSYRMANTEIEVMVAATPLLEKDAIIGAVVVEQTTNSILAIKNKVIEESIGLTLVALLFGGCGLLFFAFRISSRIRLLRNQAARAIGKNGQILNIAQSSKAKDEIGDLSRTLHAVLSQLKAQGQYREKMADNLEHEMRTPLASASASLKNLAKELENEPAHIHNYVVWALRDIKRLEDLLTAIRDAASLKQALDQGFKETFNFSEALTMWLNHSWKPTFSDVKFALNLPDNPVFIHGDPDKIRQMLDKLIENAVAFHLEGSSINLQIESRKNTYTVKVENSGQHIPEEMLEEIFSSMVSYRKNTNNTPHLGLGLYVVQTIAQHHGGTVTAGNVFGDPGGVCFSIVLPHRNISLEN